jgi:AP2 domain
MQRHAVVQPLDKPYRLIPLTQGQNAIVDASDFDWLNRWNWCAQWKPDRQCFCALRLGKREENSRRIYMSRFILGLTDPKIGADHIYGNTLDNRRENLRPATGSENHANQTRPIKNSSGYKGVVKRGEKWAAQISVRGKTIYLGIFESLERAALTYAEAAKFRTGNSERDSRS